MYESTFYMKNSLYSVDKYKLYDNYPDKQSFSDINLILAKTLLLKMSVVFLIYIEISFYLSFLIGHHENNISCCLPKAARCLH